MDDSMKERIENYKKTKAELLSEYEEIQKKLRALFNDPALTEKQKKLARKFHKDSNIPAIAYEFPNVILFYPIKYWSIKKIFIDPYNKYVDRLLQISKLVSHLDNLIYLNHPSSKTAEAWVKSQNTKVEVVIDWGFILGDCGDCS